MKDKNRFIIAVVKTGEESWLSKFHDAVETKGEAHELCLTILKPGANAPVPFVVELPKGWVLLELAHVH